MRCPYCRIRPRGRLKTTNRLGATCGRLECRLAAMRLGNTRRRKPRPLCACGCKQRVKERQHQYLAGHVPIEVRREGGRRGRRSYAFKRRQIRFGELFDRMVAGGRRLTKEAILDALAEVARYEYTIGYHACEAKWTGRTFPARKAAARSESQRYRDRQRVEAA